MLLLKAQLCEDKIELQNTKVYNTQTQKGWILLRSLVVNSCEHLTS